jgi:leader peptidase (prepilin peptidase)/N-methyltransferase
VAIPDWIWFIFIFAIGCCIGSFLNVVIYRLPRDKSLVTPPSACTACGEQIRYYDNIPLVSWLLLGRKCRHCKAPISAYYFVIELLTGLVFFGLFILYFHSNLRDGIGSFWNGGWFIYLLHILMLSAFVAASAIDLKYWVIPLSICWFVTAAGLIASTVGIYIIDPALVREYSLMPSASAGTAAMAIGAAIGLAISWVLVTTNLLKRSYESEDSEDSRDIAHENHKDLDRKIEDTNEPTGPTWASNEYDHRQEALREIAFLLPIIICSIAAYLTIRTIVPMEARNSFSVQHPAISGLLGSLWGYFVGCGIVWGIRIFGTLAFGKEAMGLGDVHLMGAAGAVIGPLYVVLAFFVAPFFGLAWAGFQMFFKKIRQIPYGPFLSLGIFIVMILHDWIRDYLSFVFYR